MKRFVVGIDGSPAAAVAVHWAAHVAAQADAEIIAVHAFEVPYSEIAPDDLHRLIADRQAQVDGEWTAIARKAGASVRSVVQEGDPRTVLLDVARAEGADLVVVGRHGHSGEPGFLHVGSLAEYCAHHASSPLAVIPTDATVPATHFVVGADGSPESLDTIAWTARLAGPGRTSVLAVVVQDHPPSASPFDNLVGGWKESLAAVGISDEPVVRNDETVTDGLVNGAEQLGADVLVVGMRGAGGFTGLRVGGTAIKALHHTKLPLILVPPAGQTKQ